MNTVAHIDYETKSAVDLKVAGLDNYARHASTDLWCMAYAFNDAAVAMWHPPLSNASVHHLLAHVEKGGTVVAHNAAFELAIWNNIMVPRYGWPVLKPEQVRCTMAMAYAMALPGSLEKAAAAVGIKEQKDLAGGRLMLQMSRPRDVKPDGTIVWWDEPDKLQRLYEYCRQDVRVERELEKRLMALSADEQQMWTLDYVINQRGVYIDRLAVQKAIAVVESEQQRLDAEMREVTGNFVGVCTETARITKWIQRRGVSIDGIAKADVADALELPDLPADVRRALMIRQEAGKSSTAKLRAMVTAASAGNRLRGMMQYHGAGTGRWAGRRVQLQNLPRPKLEHEEIERAIDVLARTPEPATAAQYIAALFGSPLDIISWSLRGMLRAGPGNDLLAADFANIEGRGLAWLAGEEWKLQAFRDFDAGKGPDIYKLMASGVLSKDVNAVTKDERQTYGKVPELACGYGGGVGAFQQMAKTYLVKVSNDVAEFAKTQWRGKHPKTVQYWYDLDDAAIRAVLNPGTVTVAGPQGRQVKFKKAGSFLWLLLPSNRALCYAYPKVLPVETPWGATRDALTYMTVLDEQQKKKGKFIPDSQSQGDWQRVSTYGGKLSENVTQAICRDLLVHSIRSAERAGYPVVFHVHDEVVAEVPKSFGSVEEFERVCSQVPAWATGIPVVASGWRGERYRK